MWQDHDRTFQADSRQTNLLQGMFLKTQRRSFRKQHTRWEYELQF
jgi:hypothetical protein